LNIRSVTEKSAKPAFSVVKEKEHTKKKGRRGGGKKEKEEYAGRASLPQYLAREEGKSQSLSIISPGMETNPESAKEREEEGALSLLIWKEKRDESVSVMAQKRAIPKPPRPRKRKREEKGRGDRVAAVLVALREGGEEVKWRVFIFRFVFSGGPTRGKKAGACDRRKRGEG